MSKRARERANARPWEQGEQPEPDDHQHAGDFPERDDDDPGSTYATAIRARFGIAKEWR